MTKWEYKIETDVWDMDLSAKGQAGWELCAIIAQGVPSQRWYFFERPITDQTDTGMK